MNKPIIILALAVVIFTLGGAAGWSFAKRASDRGVIKQQQSDAKKAVKHDANIRHLKKSLSKTLEQLKGFKDASGCLDTPSDPEYVRRLLESDRLTRP